MITAIIVDDEKIIRLGLKKMIADYCPQVVVIGEAENGKEALSLTLRENPDICVVDVRMPQMNGLEYIQRAREKGVRSKMVVLSGYADFSYAQQAISQGCSGYLLKPVKINALAELLQKLCTEILHDRREQQWVEQAKLNSFAKEKESVDLLFRKALTEDEKYGRQLRELHFLADRDYYASILSLEDTDLPQQPPLSKAQDILDKEIRRLSSWEAHCLPLDDRTVYWLLFFPEKESLETEDPYPVLEESLRAVHNEGIPCSLGMSGPFSGEEQLYLSRQQCQEAVEHRFYEGGGRVFRYSPGFFSDTEPAFYQQEKQFLTAMRVANEQEAEETLRTTFELLRSHRTRKNVCIFIFRQIHLHLLNLLHQADQDVHSGVDFSKVGEQLSEIDTFEEMSDYVETLFLQRIPADRKKNGATQRIVRNAVSYVKKNYASPIGVNEVAGYLGISSSYFSTLFRKETGEKFISFLIRYKMDKACEMLDQSNLRIYEISERLGYVDVKYFCRIFRKYIGCTPSEYRERSC